MESTNQPQAPEWLKKYGGFIIPIAAGAAIVVYFLWQWPGSIVLPASVPPDRVEELIGQRRQTVIQILAGVAVLAGFYLTLRRIRSAERNVQAVEDGQVNDRFIRALEQLGSDNITQRLGAVYALERIARDSPRDHEAQFELISSFVRLGTQGDGVKQDVQAALNVIGGRNVENDPDRFWLDLSDCDFEGYRFRGNFSKVIFRNCLFKDNDAEVANMAFARFGGCNLTEVKFHRTVLRYAKFARCTLHNVDFTDARLSHADFHKCDITEGNFSYTESDHLTFNLTEIERSTFFYARMSDSLIAHSNAVRTSWEEAELDGSSWNTFHLTDSNIAEEQISRVTSKTDVTVDGVLV